MSHEYKILNFGTIYFIVFFMCADKADENLPGGKQDYRNQSILIALNIENKPVITHIINTIERLLYICQA